MTVYEGPYEDPLRLRVLQALTALLQTIQPDSNSDTNASYAHDLSEAVFRGRADFGEGDPLPMVSILEMPTAETPPPPPKESECDVGPWDILIQGWVKDDRLNPTDPAYRLSADVRACLAREKSRPAYERRQTGRPGALFGIVNEEGHPVVTDMQIGRPVCRPSDEVSAKAYFWLVLRLEIAEDMGDPYA